MAASNLRSLEYVEDASKVTDVRLEYSLLDFGSKDDFQGHYSLVVGSRMEFVKHLAALAVRCAQRHVACSRSSGLDQGGC